MLRKTFVKKRLAVDEYVVEDIFDEEIFNMTLTEEQLLSHPDIDIGEEVYLYCSPYEPNKCDLITLADFEMDTKKHLLKKKLELDSKQAEMK